MERQIKIFDTTLRDGEQSPGCSMNLEEKLRLAKQLEILKVDIIEAGFAISSPGDFESVSMIAKTVRDCKVASLARCLEKDIDAAYDAVRHAVSPRIHVFLATSPVHMQHKLKMTPEQVVEQAVAMVKYAKSKCSDIEFSAEDAMRSEPEFLARVVAEVIKAGATVVNIPDTVGYVLPVEMSERITYLRNHVPGIERVDISVHCHNDLGMATANSLSAVLAGASQIECTLNGIGERAGNASMEEAVMAIHTRKPLFGAYTRIDTTQIYRSSKMLSSIIGVAVPPNKAIVGANAFAHEAGIHQHGVLAERTTYEIMTPESIGLLKNNMVLGKHSGRHAFEDRIVSLGFKLDKEELDDVFVQFKVLCDKKKTVSDQDIEALIQNKPATDKEMVKLEDFQITTSAKNGASASVQLYIDQECREGKSDGDGPVDAAYKAIDVCLGAQYELCDYTIRSIGEGEDAQGEVAVKLKSGERTFIGKGLSTDVIESSILAYINAINKLLA